jgi:hypothetical protein
MDGRSLPPYVQGWEAAEVGQAMALQLYQLVSAVNQSECANECCFPVVLWIAPILPY